MTCWLKANLWNLIITAVAIIVAFVALSARVTAIELQHEQLRLKIAQYPSQDYFDLRFQTIESQLNEVQADVKKHIMEK